MANTRLVRLLLIKKRLLLMKKKVLLTRKRAWIHPINKKRRELGVYDNLIQELRSDNQRHKGYLRMTPRNFDYILELIRDEITKMDTCLRYAIPPGLKLAVTLHFLAEGCSYYSIACHYRLGKSTVSYIIRDTCLALWNALQPLYLKTPQTIDEWRTVAAG